MKKMYRLANFFVLPSKAETWGLSVNESLACGTPVLVSDRCGCSADLIKEGENGFVFQSGNLESLIDKMKKSLEKQVWEKCSNNAEYSVTNFNFQRHKEAVDHLIYSIEN
jgi:glycosyltransferase involved in cell wall biosynthesis